MTQTFPLILDGSHKASKLVEIGCYGWADSWIADWLLPIERHDLTEREIELVEFDFDPTLDEVLLEFEHRGLERPTCEDALYFGVKYPDEQRKHVIVFPHEPVRDSLNRRCVLVLHAHAFTGERSLGLILWDYKWGWRYVFAGVRSSRRLLTTTALVIAGGYDWVDDSVTDKRFPLLPRDSEWRKIEGVKFDHDPTSEEVLAEFERRGLERPTYKDALYFGVLHPQEQEKHPVVFLHEPVEDLGGDRRVIALFGRPGRRCLGLDLFDHKWSRDCVFAGVRKVTSPQN